MGGLSQFVSKLKYNINLIKVNGSVEKWKVKLKRSENNKYYLDDIEIIKLLPAGSFFYSVYGS